MLTDRDHRLLTKLRPEDTKPPAYLHLESRIVIHTDWYALEFTADQYQVTKDWPGKPLEGARQWRYEFAPDADPGELVTSIRRNTAAELVTLASANLMARMNEVFYDFVHEQYDRASFVLFQPRKDKPFVVGIKDGDKLVGVVADLLLD